MTIYFCKGCFIPEDKKNAKFHGNILTVGSKGEYICEDGFAMNSTDIARTTCENNGTWSATFFKCLPGKIENS